MINKKSFRILSLCICLGLLTPNLSHAFNWKKLFSWQNILFTTTTVGTIFILYKALFADTIQKQQENKQEKMRKKKPHNNKSIPNQNQPKPLANNHALEMLKGQYFPHRKEGFLSLINSYQWTQEQIDSFQEILVHDSCGKKSFIEKLLQENLLSQSTQKKLLQRAIDYADIDIYITIRTKGTLPENTLLDTQESDFYPVRAVDQASKIKLFGQENNTLLSIKNYAKIFNTTRLFLLLAFGTMPDNTLGYLQCPGSNNTILDEFAKRLRIGIDLDLTIGNINPYNRIHEELGLAINTHDNTAETILQLAQHQNTLKSSVYNNENVIEQARTLLTEYAAYQTFCTTEQPANTLQTNISNLKWALLCDNAPAVDKLLNIQGLINAFTETHGITVLQYAALVNAIQSIIPLQNRIQREDLLGETPEQELENVLTNSRNAHYNDPNQDYYYHYRHEATLPTLLRDILSKNVTRHSNLKTLQPLTPITIAKLLGNTDFENNLRQEVLEEDDENKEEQLEKQ